MRIERHDAIDRSPPVEATAPRWVEPPPIAPDASTEIDEAPPQAVVPPVDDRRPGSPVTFGEIARIGVERPFPPIRFEAESAEIGLAARARLQSDAAWLRDRVRVWLVLAGHCDLTAPPEYAYNLGMARALAVQDYLERHGVAGRRMFAVSYGADRPETVADSPGANPLNNRVEVLAFLPPEGVEAPRPVDVTGSDTPAATEPAPPPPSDLLR
jgi:outer membrane protein OmpA-like peptidoglycan-associated protein